MTMCEGFRKHGSMFTLGPITWKQCEDEAVVLIEVKQDGVIASFPACNTCWKEAISNKGIEIISTVPLDYVKKGGGDE